MPRAVHVLVVAVLSLMIKYNIKKKVIIQIASIWAMSVWFVEKRRPVLFLIIGVIRRALNTAPNAGVADVSSLPKVMGEKVILIHIPVTVKRLFIQK